MEQRFTYFTLIYIEYIPLWLNLDSIQISEQYKDQTFLHYIDRD